MEAIKESGEIGYVDINDNATASAKLSAMIMASAIERRLGVETIPHLTSRDYSNMGERHSPSAAIPRACGTSLP